MKVNNIEIPSALEGCRNVWLYLEDGQWVISTFSQVVAKFNKEVDAIEWWKKFEMMRGFNVRNPKRSKPKKKTGKAFQSKQVFTRSRRKRVGGCTTPKHRQALLAKINQGSYDDEHQLLTLLKNATDRNEDKILNAVHQRLRIVAPETYRKLVGPLHIRDPLGIKKCFCGNPESLSEIADEIMTESIPECCLLCDACWEEDICSAWGHYGAWGAKNIDTEIWKSICERRGDTKYATY